MKKQMLMKIAALVCAAVCMLTACGGVTEEMLATRDSAIEMLERGEYEAAVDAFNSLVVDADSVTEFELDVLKYRAEAEYRLGDYRAAAHTYGILQQVDEAAAEYCYFSAMALAKAGDLSGAREQLEAGEVLDEKKEKTGYFEAVMAIADAMAAAGDRKGAGELYERLIGEGRGTSGMYNHLMLMEMEAGAYDEALKLAAKGLALGDDIAVRELRFNEAVCCEYLGDLTKALELFRAYADEFGSDERAEHEIAFLETRQ